jgi:hypothetical protein
MVRVDSILRFGSVAESRARSLGRSEIPVLQQGCTRTIARRHNKGDLENRNSPSRQLIRAGLPETR